MAAVDCLRHEVTLDSVRSIRDPLHETGGVILVESDHEEPGCIDIEEEAPLDTNGQESQMMSSPGKSDSCDQPESSRASSTPQSDSAMLEIIDVSTAHRVHLESDDSSFWSEVFTETVRMLTTPR